MMIMLAMTAVFAVSAAGIVTMVVLEDERRYALTVSVLTLIMQLSYFSWLRAWEWRGWGVMMLFLITVLSQLMVLLAIQVSRKKATGYKTSRILMADVIFWSQLYSGTLWLGLVLTNSVLTRATL
ncbi:hypothetical protein [Enterobacter cloacae]|uniref:hypothetical protein n=1 Tax=Enterobacter cloacae TaxID=550 RepID=UPI002FF622E8